MYRLNFWAILNVSCPAVEVGLGTTIYMQSNWKTFVQDFAVHYCDPLHRMKVIPPRLIDE